MKTTSLMAGASRFAHFAGLSRSSARKAAEDDQDDKGARAEDDDEDKGADDDDDADTKGKKGKRSRAKADDGDDGDDGDDKSSKRGSKASDDDDDGKDAEDEDEPKSKGKKSRRASEDDDDEDAEEDDDKEEMTGRSAKAAARRRERARCSAIFAHKSAAHNVALAASLAFDTTMTRQEAIAVMKGQAGRADDREEPRHASRERRNPDLGASHGADETRKKPGASWGRAFTKVGVAPRG